MPSPAPALQFDPKHAFSLYESGKHEALSNEFLRVFRYFETTVCVRDQIIAGSVTPFLKTFFYLFTQADYVIADKHIIPFILQNTLVANLTAISPFRTTDAYLDILRQQPSNFIKILTLYSARNRVHFDRDKFFEAKAELASLWYNQFCAIYKSGMVNQHVLNRLTEHLRYHDERMVPAMQLAEPYYGSTYIEDGLDREFKPFQNKAIQKHARFVVSDQPDPKKIAVFSDLWYPTHSVYRNYAAFVKGLRPGYHLTLFHSIMPKDKLDTGMFDEVRRVELPGGRIPSEPFAGNFQVAYFPDIGMTAPSILLSNCRIAPIQICSPGHSVSTWGGDIDYYITGAGVETRDAEKNYSERLVLLPGMGVIHNQPLYTLEGRVKDTPDIIINCPWSGHKTHRRFLRTMRTILERSEVKVRLRIFPNIGTSQDNGHLPFFNDLRAALGDDVVDLRPGLRYPDYMRLMEEGDLTLDCFHFAGCNSIADSLFLRKPTLVWEGDKWYNRIGPAMLRLVGQDEWIAENEEKYIEKALVLIHNEKKRTRIAAKLKGADLDSTIFSTKDAPAFKRAVDYLIANHTKLQKDKGRKAIVIKGR